MLKRTFFSFCSICLISLPLLSQDIIPPGKLQAEVDALKKDPDMLHASWSLCVMRVSDNKVMASHNSAQSLVPASTLKILTTGAALSVLGADYKYETRIEYDGALDTVTGILKGNVYIKGSGDPSLESEYFRNKNDTITTVERWALILKQKGIKKITGSIIADASCFEDDMLPSTWIWSDMGNYFGAGSCGLNFMDNKYTVYFNSSNAGGPTTVSKMFPEIPGLEFINNVSSGGSGDNTFIYGSPYSYKRYAKGTVPENKKDYDVDGSMPDPAWFCAYMFDKALKRCEINITGAPTSVKIMKEKSTYEEKRRNLLHTYYSPPLEKIIYYTNLKSVNAYAEALLKTVAVKKGMFGSTSAGTDAVINFWRESGVDVSGLYMADGSGLSRVNTVTAQQHVMILTKIYKGPVYEAFNNSLPVAGKSGSLGSLCKGTFAENNMRAKSGYITRARGYAGYVKNKKGEELVFSLLANNYECTAPEMKKKLEKIMVLLTELE